MANSHIFDLKDIQNIEPTWELLSIISKSLAEKTQTLVFGQEGNAIALLTTNKNPQLYHQIVDKLEAQGYAHTTYFTDETAFEAALERYTILEKKQKKEAEILDWKAHATGDDAIGLIKETFAKIDVLGESDFISEIFKLSYQAGASDVHFQTEEIGVVMRLRIDGVLQTVIVFSHEQFQKYLMKIKYMSGVKMNIAKTMQDGRFDFDMRRDNEIIKIDVRVSVLPGLRGESITLRFLDATQSIMDFKSLGCEPYHVGILEQELERNYGLILITGPTGSGKTTTVYSLLNHLNHPSKKIITLENPVEYEMPGIEQSQINEKAGYTFEEGLRGVLRHDPDIIMVGEIRSLETADMAVNAALTGHLVISTIHTNTAVEAINRLLNMGVKPFMLASSLNCIIGQRLLRKMAKPRALPAPKYIDDQIKETMEKIKTFTEYKKLSYDGNIYQPDKRVAPHSDGYQGRIAVYEMLQVDQDIKQFILNNASTLDILAYTKAQGFLTMQDNAIIKMLQEVTSLEEIERVLS